MGPGSLLSVFVLHQGDQTYVQSGMYTGFRTTIIEALALSPSLFLLTITIPDARAITMEKKKKGSGTDPFHFLKPIYLSSRPLCFVSVGSWKLAGGRHSGDYLGHVREPIWWWRAASPQSPHRQSTNLHFMRHVQPKRKKRWQPRLHYTTLCLRPGQFPLAQEEPN